MFLLHHLNVWTNNIMACDIWKWTYNKKNPRHLIIVSLNIFLKITCKDYGLWFLLCVKYKGQINLQFNNLHQTQTDDPTIALSNNYLKQADPKLWVWRTGCTWVPQRPVHLSLLFTLFTSGHFSQDFVVVRSLMNNTTKYTSTALWALEETIINIWIYILLDAACQTFLSSQRRSGGD